VGTAVAGMSAQGMKAVIIFSCLNILINGYQSITLILERVPITLPEEIKDIYNQCFRMMTTSEFGKLYGWASLKRAVKGEHLATQDEQIPDLILIREGSASITKDGRVVSTLGSGFFIGEMSFLTGGLANATVEAVSDDLSYIIWRKDALNELQNSNLQLYIKLKQAIAINMIRKMDRMEHRD
jgi:signal-transduction protein with cAMP-binding, CBS, and nucleotidyltransferase domain